MNRQPHNNPVRHSDPSLDETAIEVEENELDFNDDEPPTRAGERVPDDDVARAEPAHRVREAGITGGSVIDDDRTMDDLTPDTLISEDGARSPAEAGGRNTPADQQLKKKPGSRIGAGEGLDEAELARKDPLDGQPWDGEAD